MDICGAPAPEGLRSKKRNEDKTRNMELLPHFLITIESIGALPANGEPVEPLGMLLQRSKKSGQHKVQPATWRRREMGSQRSSKTR